MKDIKIILNVIFFSTIAFFMLSSCEEEDKAAKDPLLGFYTISKSVLTADCSSENGAATLPSGTNVTAEILNAFLSDIVCNSTSDKAIELADNGKIYFACRVEGKQQNQGTWAINADRSELTLTLIIQGAPVPLKLTGFKESASKLNGNVASIPVPPLLLSTIESLFSGVDDEAILISIDIELEKLN